MLLSEAESVTLKRFQRRKCFLHRLLGNIDVIYTLLISSFGLQIPNVSKKSVYLLEGLWCTNSVLPVHGKPTACTEDKTGVKIHVHCPNNLLFWGFWFLSQTFLF